MRKTERWEGGREDNGEWEYIVYYYHSICHCMIIIPSSLSPLLVGSSVIHSDVYSIYVLTTVCSNYRTSYY